MKIVKRFFSMHLVQTRNISLLVLLFFSIITVGCKKDDNNGPDNPPDTAPIDTLVPGNGTTTPYIKATFIDFWHKENWDVSKWSIHMQEMKEIGIKTLIIQFSAYNETIWCYSDNDYSQNIYPDALDNLLRAAEMNEMGVYVGLYFNEEFWQTTNDPDVLKLHAKRCNDLADDIWKQVKNNRAFAGWYIPHEGAPYYYNTDEKFKIIRDNLINPVANHCKTLSDKPVSMSAFFNHNLSSTSVFRNFMKNMGKCNLDLILLQDGIGVDHCDLSDMESYFNAANDGLYADAGYKGAFWADIEIFTPEFKPEDIDVVIQKLKIADDYVSKIAIFQYYAYMCPTGTNGSSAKKLRNDYLIYLYKN